MAVELGGVQIGGGNPFKPGAGHSPPHLAGREKPVVQFRKLLQQETITQNIILTGLRGVGKTVLMDDVYKPIAQREGWVWVGSDLSESAFVSELTLCNRLLTDLSLFTANLTVAKTVRTIGFRTANDQRHSNLGFNELISYFGAQPGLIVDKLKATLEYVWQAIESTGKKGVIFAYDEAQVVQDRRDKEQYPLAVLLETFQSLQRKGMRYMLLLTGLPTLFPKLVESRTYSERMFTIQEIGKLEKRAGKEAIEKPLEDNPIRFSAESVESIIKVSACYPYFIQFICRESYDYLKSIRDKQPAKRPAPIPIETLVRKLDADFFAGRWSRVTDRQRDLLFIIAALETAAGEFTVAEIVERSKTLSKEHRSLKRFKTGDVSQILPKLIDAGLVYKNRHGKYSLAVPLFDSYIRSQFENYVRRRVTGGDLFSEFD